MKHNYVASYQNIKLRPLAESDIELLRVWRNDKEQTAYLREIPTITPEMQKKWFEASQKDETEYVFAIDETEQLNRLVGSVAVYDVNGGIAEAGRVQIGDKEAHGRGLGRVAMALVMWFGFEELHLEKILGTVYKDNIPAYKNDMKLGFKIVGEHMDDAKGIEYDLEIDRSSLLKMNPFLQEVKFETND